MQGVWEEKFFCHRKNKTGSKTMFSLRLSFCLLICLLFSNLLYNIVRPVLILFPDSVTFQTFKNYRSLVYEMHWLSIIEMFVWYVLFEERGAYCFTLKVLP